jgi:hypothetical protein
LAIARTNRGILQTTPWLREGFSISTNDNDASVSAKDESVEYDEELEDIVANNIIEWWLSRKSYKQWYNEKFHQQTLDFNEEE